MAWWWVIDARPLRADIRLDAADDAGATAERHQRDPGVAAPVEDGDGVGVTRRPQHRVRRVVDPATKAAQDVAVGPAEAVPRPVEGLGGRQRRQGRRQRPADAVGPALGASAPVAPRPETE
jgi:hypothetical protein